MNKAILCGRLTKDPDVRYSQGAEPMAIARYTLAVDRRGRSTKEGEQTADFISCIAFGKAGEFAEKYLKKGTKMLITGRIQTGSYTNKEGVKVYTTDIVVEDQEFAELFGRITLEMLSQLLLMHQRMTALWIFQMELTRSCRSTDQQKSNCITASKRECESIPSFIA